MDTETRVDRAAGAGTRGGKLRVGAHVPTVGGAKASIPSRFETVLNTDAREQNGFGRRTFRFDEPINDLPGPGAYSKSRSILNRSQVNLSCSAKGTAAFASNTKGTTLVPTSVFTPGPAAYCPEKPRTQAMAGSAPSAAFKNPSDRRMLRVTAVAKPVPGPGAYRPEDYGREKPGGLMTTQGEREVGPLKGPRLAPGPGEFQPESYVNPLGSLAAKARSARPRTPPSSPQAAQARAAAAAKTSLPPVMLSDMGRDLPAAVVDAAAERHNRELRTLVAGALRPVEAKPVARTAAFADTSLDRFGNPTVRYTAVDDGNLGPGAYELETKPRRMLISSSWALSAVERGSKKDRWAVPGPAYYSSEPSVNKVSHHMLSADYWSH
jgi:hypothetical protein